MLGDVLNVQRQEIRQGIACVKHQNMSGSDIGDDHKEYFAGEAALKAGGAHNTMNQFAYARPAGDLTWHRTKPTPHNRRVPGRCFRPRTASPSARGGCPISNRSKSSRNGKRTTQTT